MVMGWFGDTPLSYQSQYAVILGEVLDEGKHRLVTLRDCVVSRQTFSPHKLGNTLEFLASAAFIGAHLTNENDFTFRWAELSFSGLSGWAFDLSGFPKEEDQLSFSWKDPGHLTGQIPGGTFVLGAGCSSSATRREKQLKEEIRFSLSFTHAIRETELLGTIVYQFQNFLTFATDHPNALTRLRVSRDILPFEDIKIIGFTTFSDESLAADVLPYKMLFSLADISSRVQEVVGGWFELSKRYSDVFGIYFGGIYRPPGYADWRFPLMMQVLSLYHAQRKKDLKCSTSLEELETEAAKRLPKDLTAKLTKALDSHPVVSAERALTALISEHKAEFEPLVADKDGQARQFVAYVLNTTQYTLTRDGPQNPFASQAADLHWATECIAFLFKISILKELGFTPDQVHSILHRNPRYTHIRDTIRAHAGWARPADARAERAHRMSIIEGRIEVRMEQLGGSVVAPIWPERKEGLAGIDLPQLQRLASELESIDTLEQFNNKVVGAISEAAVGRNA